MKVEVYDRITYDLITSAVCEEYKIYIKQVITGASE